MSVYVGERSRMARGEFSCYANGFPNRWAAKWLCYAAYLEVAKLKAALGWDIFHRPKLKGGKTYVRCTPSHSILVWKRIIYIYIYYYYMFWWNVVLWCFLFAMAMSFHVCAWKFGRTPPVMPIFFDHPISFPLRIAIQFLCLVKELETMSYLGLIFHEDPLIC